MKKLQCPLGQEKKTFMRAISLNTNYEQRTLMKNTIPSNNILKGKKKIYVFFTSFELSTQRSKPSAHLLFVSSISIFERSDE